MVETTKTRRGKQGRDTKNVVGKWWGGQKEFEYDYRQYSEIAKATGCSVPAEWQRTKRLYLKVARAVVNEYHPEMPEEEKEQLSQAIVTTDWWEDCIRRAWEERSVKKKKIDD